MDIKLKSVFHECCKTRTHFYVLFQSILQHRKFKLHRTCRMYGIIREHELIFTKLESRAFCTF